MMAHTTLALCLFACLCAAVPKLAISLLDVIHPAVCPGLVNNGLLAATLGVSFGNQAECGGRNLSISILLAPQLHQS